MSGQCRFEIVTAARDRHWARFIAGNGKTVWVTETYKRRQGAENAISVVTGSFINRRSDGSEVHWPANRETQLAEVRYIDDRLHKVERPALGEPGAS